MKLWCLWLQITQSSRQMLETLRPEEVKCAWARCEWLGGSQVPSLTGPRITINLNTINTLITTVLLSDEFICTPVTNNRTRAHLISSHLAHTPLSAYLFSFSEWKLPSVGSGAFVSNCSIRCATSTNSIIYETTRDWKLRCGKLNVFLQLFI